MNKSAAVFIISFIFTALFLSVTLTQNTFAKSAKDSKARRDIDRAVGRAVEGKFSTVKTVNISTYTAPNESITVYNKTSSGSLPPIITPPPNPEPPVVVTPAQGYKVCMVGDFKDAKIFDAMKTDGCNYRVALGDNGYGSDLKLLKSIAPDKCVPGNHDAKEDGSASLEKEALAYCGDSWWTKFGSQTLMLGFNTNGDSAKQLNAAKSLLTPQFMQGVKNVIVVSHKGGHVFPNAHHPAEAAKFYSELEKLIPQSSIQLYEISGHNHNAAAAAAKGWYVSGNGGKSFYACGLDTDWTFCNNKTVAYLQATIPDNNQIAFNFIDTAGKTLH